MVALMSNRYRFICSSSVENKDVSGGLLDERAIDRDVVIPLDALLAVAVILPGDPRASRRRALGRTH